MLHVLKVTAIQNVGVYTDGPSLIRFFKISMFYSASKFNACNQTWWAK